MNTPPEAVRLPNAVDLVTSAIGGQAPSLSGMLAYLADGFKACGCVLWECRPDDEDRQDTLENQQLFVLASHFQGSQLFALHDLPVSKSLTGQALLRGDTLSSPDIQNDDSIVHIDPVVTRLWLGPMVTAPITFLDGTRGAINLYRKQGERAFEIDDEKQLTRLAPAIVPLYHAIRDRVSLELINDINDLLTARKDELIVESNAAAETGLRLKQVARRVAETFHSIEVSIFLEDPLEAPGEFRCVATTWPKPIEKHSYTKDPNDGMTGWALFHEKPVLIFDWETYPQNRSFYDRSTSGAVWNDPLNIIATARDLLKLGPDDSLPPVSYLSTPMFDGTRVIGIIRCTAGRLSAPYYYNKRDLKLLQLVAAQLSRHWEAWLHGRKIVAEKETWAAHTFEDLQHQLRGPLNQVQRRIEWLMQEYGWSRQLTAIRGLCRKAVRATRSIGVLAKLADDKPLSLTLVPLSYSVLIALLIDLAEDNQVLVEPERGIRFEVNQGSFAFGSWVWVGVDLMLFQQTLNNILDNAGKYSYPNTIVRVFGGQTREGYFHITVANTGIPIRSEDVETCLLRGKRLDEARHVLYEGSGIGLWIANKVMKAHKGELSIIPTSDEGETQVKLVFPLP